MNTLTDNALMLKVKGGDLDKMSLLFERYHYELYRFIYHMTLKREMSEDMVQQSFYKMLKYSHTFTGAGEFRSWMYSIARNVMNDHFRKKSVRVVTESVDLYTDGIEGGMTPDEYLEKKQAKAALHRAMQRLSTGNRELLVMCRFQEMKYQEIADLLGISESAVKARIHRAMQELKSIYLTMETN